MKGKRREKNSSLKKYIVAARYAGMELEQYLKEVMSVSARQRQKLFFSRGVYVNGSSAAFNMCGGSITGNTAAQDGGGVYVENGKFKMTAGTIGGGCSENAVMRQAHDLIGTGQKRCVTVNMSNDVAEEEGMVCGGQMKVFLADVESIDNGQ